MEFYNRDCHNNNMFYENEKDFNNSYYNNERKNCCVKRVEETFCCYPSYYSEEKEEDKKDEHFYPCYEGRFTLCPRKSYCDKHDDDRNFRKEEKQYNQSNRNKCCFCNLFSRW